MFMNKNYGCIWKTVIALIWILAFPACNTVPVARVHSAASIPRFVDVNPESFAQEKQKSAIGMNAGVGYGLSFSDVGNAYGSQIYHIGINYRNPKIAFGWTPYLGLAQVSHEGTGVFGSVLWLALNFGGGDNWRFSYQNTYTAVTKTNEDKGCAHDTGFFFYSSCPIGTESSTRAEVKVRDLGFILTAEYRLHDSDSLLIAPAAYWTWISTGNKLDVDPNGDYTRRTSFWNPGLQLGYVTRFGEKLNKACILMAGAQWVKTFRPDWAVRELLPTADLKFQF
jgi:hypothetical protein